jgi:hypothetical protein
MAKEKKQPINAAPINSKLARTEANRKLREERHRKHQMRTPVYRKFGCSTRTEFRNKVKDARVRHDDPTLPVSVCIQRSRWS